MNAQFDKRVNEVRNRTDSRINELETKSRFDMDKLEANEQKLKEDVVIVTQKFTYTEQDITIL